jgi:hypothetical protein
VARTRLAGKTTIPANYNNQCGTPYGRFDQLYLPKWADRIHSKGQWTYAASYGSSASTTKVTDPLGNQEVHTFSCISCPTFGGSSYETEVQYYNSSGSLLRTITKAYAYDGMYAGPGNLPDTAGNVRVTSETTILPNGLQKQIQTDYEIV